MYGPTWFVNVPYMVHVWLIHISEIGHAWVMERKHKVLSSLVSFGSTTSGLWDLSCPDVHKSFHDIIACKVSNRYDSQLVGFKT